MISIRNQVTGEEKNFQDKQAVADFLEERGDEDQWDGVSRLGKLPEPTRNGEKPANPKPIKVAVDDGRRADESATRHLVDPVYSEDASAENQAKEEAERRDQEAAQLAEQNAAAEVETKAQARGRKAEPAKTTRKTAK